MSSQNLARGRTDPVAVAGVVCGVVGLFIGNLVLGVLAIGLGVIARRQGGGRRRAGVPAIVLGVLDLVVLALLVTNLRHATLI